MRASILFIFIFASGFTFAQRSSYLEAYKLLDKAESLIQRKKYRKARIKLDRANNYSFGSCGQGVGATRARQMYLYSRIQSDQGNYSAAADILNLDSAPFANYNIDSIKIEYYALAYGRQYVFNQISKGLDEEIQRLNSTKLGCMEGYHPIQVDFCDSGFILNKSSFDLRLKLNRASPYSNEREHTALLKYLFGKDYELLNAQRFVNFRAIPWTFEQKTKFEDQILNELHHIELVSLKPKQGISFDPADTNWWFASIILDSNRIDTTRIKTVVRLPDQGVSELLQLVYEDESHSTARDCYNPRHGILFFNEEHHRIGYLEICFECYAVRFMGDFMKPEELSEQQFADLRSFFQRYMSDYLEE